METKYKLSLQKRFDSGEHIQCPLEYNVMYKNILIGIADDYDDKYIIEIKDIRDWKHALGQVIAYSFFEGKKGKLKLLEVENVSKTLVEAITMICNSYDIELEIISRSDM